MVALSYKDQELTSAYCIAHWNHFVLEFKPHRHDVFISSMNWVPEPCSTIPCWVNKIPKWWIPTCCRTYKHGSWSFITQCWRHFVVGWEERTDLFMSKGNSRSNLWEKFDQSLALLIIITNNVNILNVFLWGIYLWFPHLFISFSSS